MGACYSLELICSIEQAQTFLNEFYAHTIPDSQETLKRIAWAQEEKYFYVIDDGGIKNDFQICLHSKLEPELITQYDTFHDCLNEQGIFGGFTLKLFPGTDYLLVKLDSNFSSLSYILNDSKIIQNLWVDIGKAVNAVVCYLDNEKDSLKCLYPTQDELVLPDYEDIFGNDSDSTGRQEDLTSFCSVADVDSHYYQITSECNYHNYRTDSIIEFILSRNECLRPILAKTKPTRLSTKILSTPFVTQPQRWTYCSVRGLHTDINFTVAWENSVDSFSLEFTNCTPYNESIGERPGYSFLIFNKDLGAKLNSKEVQEAKTDQVEGIISDILQAYCGKEACNNTSEKLDFKWNLSRGSTGVFCRKT